MHQTMWTALLLSAALTQPVIAQKTHADSAQAYPTRPIRVVVHIPYRGTPEALTDTISGRTHYYLASVVVAIPLIREGRLLGLAVTTAQRAPLMPDVPTVSEAGLPGFEYDGWIGMLAPSATPRRILDRISREVARILDLSDVKERITSVGGRPRSSTPGVFDKFIRSEIETRSQVLKSSGIKPE